MTNPNTITEKPYTNFCIYGRSGVGKSYFAGTYGSRTCFLSIGGGALTLKSPLYKKLGYEPMIVELNIPAVNQRGIPGDLFDKVCDTIDEILAKDADRFDVFVLDDQSSLSRAARIKGMEINPKSKTLDIAKQKKNFPLPEINDYFPEQGLLGWFFDSYTKIFREKKKHFIITAHERILYKKRDAKDIGNPEPAIFRVQPDVVGQTAWAPGDYMGFFDNVWRMSMEPGFKDKGESVWRNKLMTQPNVTILAKTRNGGVFADEIINPNLKDIITHVEESNQPNYKKPLFKGK